MKGRNEYNMRRNLKKTVVLVLVVMMCMSTFVLIAQARASLYISSFGAAATAVGGGNVNVGYTITGTGVMDDIGSTEVHIFERLPNSSTWNFVRVYRYSQSGNGHMLGSNKHTHSSSITYQGTAGRQYYAIVYFWAGKNNAGDSRTSTTSVVTAY